MLISLQESHRRLVILILILPVIRTLNPPLRRLHPVHLIPPIQSSTRRKKKKKKKWTPSSIRKSRTSRRGSIV